MARRSVTAPRNLWLEIRRVPETEARPLIHDDRRIEHLARRREAVVEGRGIDERLERRTGLALACIARSNWLDA